MVPLPRSTLSHLLSFPLCCFFPLPRICSNSQASTIIQVENILIPLEPDTLPSCHFCFLLSRPDSFQGPPSPAPAPALTPSSATSEGAPAFTPRLTRSSWAGLMSPVATQVVPDATPGPPFPQARVRMAPPGGVQPAWPHLAALLRSHLHHQPSPFLSLQSPSSLSSTTLLIPPWRGEALCPPSCPPAPLPSPSQPPSCYPLSLTVRFPQPLSSPPHSLPQKLPPRLPWYQLSFLHR